MLKIKILLLAFLISMGVGMLSPILINAQFNNESAQVSESLLLAQTEPEDPDSIEETEDENQPETCLGLTVEYVVSFGWLLCPIFSFLANVVQGMFEWTLGKAPIGGEKYCNLIVEFDDTGTSGCGTEFDREQVLDTWNAFRTLANIFFVLAFLYAIYQVAFAGGNNAYLVRSILPRLAAAAVLVQLSFFLSEQLIIIANDLGGYIDQLFNWVFRDQEDFALGAIIFGVDDGSFSEIIVSRIAATALVVLFIFSWTSILAAVGLSLLIVLLVLVARKLLILIAVVLAPIAAIAWIHPQTDGFAKAWWHTFSKLLLMYPLIILLIRSGELMARASSGTGDSALFDLMRFIAFFAPFFLIPFTFTFAGGIIGQAAGFANNARKGFVDRAKQVDERRRGYRREEARAQYKTEKALGKKPNIVTRTRAGLLGSSILYGSKGGDVFNAEQVSEAKHPDDKIQLLNLKAEQEMASIADFKLQQDIAKATSEGVKMPGIKAMVAEKASREFGTPEQAAAFRQLLTLRAVPELQSVMMAGASGTARDREVLDKLKNQNFGAIDSMAAPISRGEYAKVHGENVFKPAYEALGGLNAEQFAAQRPEIIAGGLRYAALENRPMLAEQMITSYSNSAPHQRNNATSGIISSFVESGGQVPVIEDVPVKDELGNIQTDPTGKIVYQQKPKTDAEGNLVMEPASITIKPKVAEQLRNSIGVAAASPVAPRYVGETPPSEPAAPPGPYTAPSGPPNPPQSPAPPTTEAREAGASRIGETRRATMGQYRDQMPEPEPGPGETIRPEPEEE